MLGFSSSFVVLTLTFRYLIHFELIFVYGMRKLSKSILLQAGIQLHHHRLRE